LRYSLITLIGSGLITIAAGCSDTDDGSVPTNDAKAGHSSKAGAAGKGGSGKGGTSGKGGSGATGGASAGKGGSGSGNVGTGGTRPHAGTGGTATDAGASGTDTGAGAGGFSGASDSGGEAGTAGAGGDAGSSSGPACPGGVACGAECIDPSVRTLDQIQLQSGGSIVLNNTQRPGQSFTVGSAGLLAGVELAVSACNGANTTAQIQLELFDEQAASLGHVTLDPTPLRTDCGLDDLVEETVGLGYFDLTPLCLTVEVGTQLTFALSLVGGAPDTCDTGTYQCSSSGAYCFSDNDCGGSYNVGFTNCGGTGCDSTGYAGGEAVLQDVDSGALTPMPSFEVEFKTFVQ